MIVYTHNDCLKKYNGQNHPERKERLNAIKATLPCFVETSYMPPVQSGKSVSAV